MSSRWGPMSSPDKHTEHRAGFVNIIGNPNVGKSTLMNALVGEKLSIVTAKAQTTRHRIMGIVNTDDCQIVYSDTPGMLKPNYRLQEDMMKFVDAAIGDADIILYVTDVVENSDKNIEYIAYDMLFGNKYLYNGMVPVKAPHMKMGVDVIELNEIKNESGHVVVKGSNFNEYSVVFCEDEELKTTYVDRNTLMIENYEAIQGKRFSVKQLDGGHNIFGSTNDYIF